MASYQVNDAAVARCRELIAAKQYVLESDWGDVAARRRGAERLPRAAHLGRSTPPGTSASPSAPTTRPRPGTASAYGDLRRVHRSALIACVYRASEWRHKAVELAAHGLLQELDKAAGIVLRRTKSVSKPFR